MTRYISPTGVEAESYHLVRDVALDPIPTLGRQERTIWALLFGNFVIGTGILLPAGMLTDLADAFHVTVPGAGMLMLVSGVVVALGAPLIAASTSGIDRRAILSFSILLYIAGHALAAFSSSFEMLIATRVLIAIGAAIFTPQAAATLAALVPPDRRASAITLAFVGWSLATVAGMPMGGWLAHTIGWDRTFMIMAGISAIALIAVWITVPPRVHIAPLSAKSWRAVATNPALLLVLLVTILNGSGQFTLLTYLNPSLKASLAAGPTEVALILAWFGIWATFGNVVASRFVARIGPGQVVTASLIMIVLALALWGGSASTLPLVLGAAALWGLGTFSSNSVQQARLSAMAPDLASASVALNTSAMYVGQGTAAALGGGLIKAGHMAALPLAGAVIVFAAAILSGFVLAWRKG